MTVPDAKRLKDLEAENTRLKKLLAEQLLGLYRMGIAIAGMTDDANWFWPSTRH